MERAAVCAAINCSRLGCDPPTAAQLAGVGLALSMSWAEAPAASSAPPPASTSPPAAERSLTSQLSAVVGSPAPTASASPTAAEPQASAASLPSLFSSATLLDDPGA